MKKVALSLFSILFLFSLVAAQPRPDLSTPEDLVIQVAPQTIILGRDSNNEEDVRVTIHAEIVFPSEYEVSVWLEGGGTVIPASSIFPDNRGELVAKFPYHRVAELLGPGDATLILQVVDGSTTHTGEDDIRVIQKR
jgi:hypothetical protein